MKDAAGLAVGVVVIIAALIVLGLRLPSETDTPAATSVSISEVVASNVSTIADEDGDYSDWIELHNHGAQPIELDGHHLSDDPSDPDRWTFPDITLSPDERLIVWASGKDRRDADSELHTDFRVSQAGEPLLLSAPGGQTLLDQLEPVEIPANASFGRDLDTGQSCFFEHPTPGESNDGTCHAAAPDDPPQLSEPGGFHPQDVELAMHTTSDLDIYYTLDGSYPDPVDNADATLIYEAPVPVTDRSDEPNVLADIQTAVPDPPFSQLIADWDGPDEPVQKATVVRARTPFSEETTATYFIGDDLVRPDLPVVSIATDTHHLFDDTTGIYVAGDHYQAWRDSDDYDPEAHWSEIPANFHQRGRAWERPAPDDAMRAAVFTYCEPDDGCVYTSRAGLRIHGGVSRSFPIKSFRLYARNAYDESNFEHPFFGEDAATSHRRLLLRASGNDWNQTMLLDGYVQSLLSHLNVETQDYQPTVTFVNGEYWGVMNLRDRYDQHYLSIQHDVDPNDVIMLERGDGVWELSSGQPGDEQPYAELLEFVEEEDLSDQAAFDTVAEQLDIDDLLDYLLVQIFSGNGDWPGNNTQAWRLNVDPDPSAEGPQDGRWRWLVYDLDQLGGNRIDPDDETLARLTTVPSSAPLQTFGLPLLLTNLLENDDFRARFISHAADHLNTTFAPARTVPQLDELEDLLADEMERHVARWPGPVSMDHWRNNVDLLREFMRERPAVYRDQLADRFDLAGTTELHVRTSEGGSVHVNDVVLNDSTPGVTDPTDWRGTYFQGVEVTLHAQPEDGYTFVGWAGLDGEVADQTVSFVPGESPVEVEAVFAPA